MFKCNTLITSILLVVSLLLLAACQTLPLKESLPDNLAAEKIVRMDENGPFAITPDGSVVALADSGLKLFHIPTKQQIPLSDKEPLKLAWCLSGSNLAALFANGGNSSIVIYDQYGSVVTSAVIKATITDIGWLSESELALGGMKVREYKFGSNYTSMLYRWEPGKNEPVATELRDVTLQPNTIRKAHTLLSRGPMMAFSSQTPLISYFHPIDPPVFDPHYQLVIRELASGKEIEIDRLSLFTQGARLSADGEYILFGDGKGVTTLRNLWSEESRFSATTPGANLALAPGSRYWFSDGTLFRNAAPVALLAAGADAQFTPDGRRLVLRAGKDLYLVSGITASEGGMFVPALTEKLQLLRSMRAEGLITPNEYSESLKRIVP